MTNHDKSHGTTADPRQVEKAPHTTGKDGGMKPETPVSDKRTPKDGRGEHGRPTDDSDPGHS